MNGRVNYGRMKGYATAAQRAAGEAASRSGKDVYVEKRQGAGIVAAFKRYIDSGDPSKITEGLYHLLSMRCGFHAHFNLGGFQRDFHDPLRLIQGDLYPMVGHRARNLVLRYPSEYVYTDGMTATEVLEQIIDYAEGSLDMIRERSAQREREQDLATARALAAKHGQKVVGA